jgi:hypothetical protein
MSANARHRPLTVSAFCQCGWGVSVDEDDPRMSPQDLCGEQPGWKGPKKEAPATGTVLAARLASRLVLEHRISRHGMHTGARFSKPVSPACALSAAAGSGRRV